MGSARHRYQPSRERSRRHLAATRRLRSRQGPHPDRGSPTPGRRLGVYYSLEKKIERSLVRLPLVNGGRPHG